MHSTLRFAFTLLVGSLGAACGGGGGDPSGPAAPKPGLNILAHSHTSDTVLARISAPIQIEYRSADGQPQAGVQIRFESIDVKPLPVGVQPMLYLNLVPLPIFTLVSVETMTDAAGRAGVYVHLGRAAGVARVRVSAPALGTADTIAFTVSPGGAGGIQFTPGDTMLVVGGSVSLSAVAVDRWNNPRTDPVRLALASGTSAATLEGGTLRGTAFGPVVVHASSGALSDSMRVGVVPPGRLALMQNRAHSSDSVRILLINTDLSGRRMLGGPSSTEWSDRSPTWSPAGDRLVVSIGYHFARLFFVDTTSGAVTRAIQYTTPVESEQAAQYSRDGQWIYYEVTPTHQDAQIWRVQADGSGAALIGLPGDWYDIDASPSPSPDGTQLVYHTNRTFRDSNKPMLMLLNVSTRDTVGLNAGGINPRWSPTGSDIVYIENGTLKLIRPDGTGQRVIGVQTGGYSGFPAWSPDGQWVIANGGSGLQLIRVTDGEVLFYPASTKQFVQPAWRP